MWLLKEINSLPGPISACLQPCIILAIGFINISVWYFSGTSEIGYMIGVAQKPSWTKTSQI
jgi:hypothetical protein